MAGAREREKFLSSSRLIIKYGVKLNADILERKELAYDGIRSSTVETSS
jgi:hypothetical protein